MVGNLSPGAERARLIEQYLPLVKSVARRFSGRGEGQDDLAQVAALALVRAVDRRDPARSTTLPAYFARCVEGEVRRHLRDRTSTVRVPRALQIAEARDRLDVARTPVELDDGSEAAADPLRLDETAANRGLVADAMKTLGERERQIVLLTFFFDYTQSDIAALLGISQAHVSRLLDRAVETMRCRLEGAASLSGSNGRATLEGGDGTRAAAAPPE